jgi:hypothetical protein
MDKKTIQNSKIQDISPNQMTSSNTIGVSINPHKPPRPEDPPRPENRGFSVIFLGCGSFFPKPERGGAGYGLYKKFSQVPDPPRTIK